MIAKAAFNANKLHIEIIKKKSEGVYRHCHTGIRGNWENRWSSYILHMMPEVLLNFM